MTHTYHAGELAVQERAGVREQASRMGRGIHDEITPPAALFLRQQRLAVVSSVDARGRVWASLLHGAPGFLEPLDAHAVRIHAEPAPGDPLRDNLRSEADVGIVVVDLATRQRARLNGRAQRIGGGFVVHARQVYGNCPRYIQARRLEAALVGHTAPRPVRRDTALSPAQMRWIAAADTFFIGTFHAEGGADASHRGGNAGFVQVVSASALLVPDYAGNTMFNTLGNIAANPRAGLLFIDFDRGSTLQTTGAAEIVWEPARAGDLVGAERVVRCRLEETIETEAALPWRWGPVEASPHNPA